MIALDWLNVFSGLDNGNVKMSIMSSGAFFPLSSSHASTINELLNEISNIQVINDCILNYVKV